MGSLLGLGSNLALYKQPYTGFPLLQFKTQVDMFVRTSGAQRARLGDAVCLVTAVGVSAL